MKLDETAKAAARVLGDSINDAIGTSESVVEAIEHLRGLGYEPQLSVKLEIALMKTGCTDDFEDDDNAELDLTEADVKALRRMKIRID